MREAKNSPRIRQDYVFVGKDNTLESDAGNGYDETRITIINKALNLSSIDAYMGINRYSIDDNEKTDVIIRYSTDASCDSFSFQTKDGLSIPLKEIDGAAIERVGSNQYITKLSLRQKDLCQLAYCYSEESNITVLKLVSNDHEIDISSASVINEKGGYGWILPIDDLSEIVDPIVIVKASTCKTDGAYIFDVQQNKVDISVCNGESAEIMGCDDSISCDIASNVAYTCKEPIGTGDIKSQMIDNTDQVEENDLVDDQVEEYIDSVDYLSLEEGGVASIYLDGAVFTRDKKECNFVANGRLVDTDTFISGYTNVSSSGIDYSGLVDPIDLLGSSYEDMLLSGNILALKVKGNHGAQYAGQLVMRNRGTSVTEVVKAATISETGITESNSESKKANVDTETDGHNPDESEETTPDNEAEVINVAAQYVVQGNVDYLSTFRKTAYDIFESDQDAVTMTEGFLRKASYAAVDAYGTVCAVFDENGIITALAEGYTESDIDAFIIIPDVEATEDGDLSVESIAVAYNDILAQDDNYVSIIYSDENGQIDNPDVTISTFAGASEQLVIDILPDEENRKILVAGNVTEDNICIQSGEDYSVVFTSGEDINNKEMTQSDGDEAGMITETGIATVGDLPTETGESGTQSKSSDDADTEISLDNNIESIQGEGIVKGENTSDENTAGEDTTIPQISSDVSSDKIDDISASVEIIDKIEKIDSEENDDSITADIVEHISIEDDSGGSEESVVNSDPMIYNDGGGGIPPENMNIDADIGALSYVNTGQCTIADSGGNNNPVIESIIITTQ